MRWKCLVSLALVLTIGFWMLPSGKAFAQITQMIRYQGTLTDSAGTPLDGSYSLTFRFYNASTGGTMVWEEIQNGISVSKGAFSVLLGQLTSLTLAFDADYWLAVSVNGGAELTPRSRVASVPNAYLAQTASKIEKSEGVQTANFLKNGSFESWSQGTTQAPDGWLLTSATVSRDTTNVHLGQAAAAITVSTGTGNLRQPLPSWQVSHLKGHSLTFCAWVKTSTTSKVKLNLADGVGSTASPYHSGSGSWQMLTVTRTVDANATTVEAQIAFDGAATATVDCVNLNEGPMPFDFSPHPADPFLVPRNIPTSGTVSTTSTAYVAVPDLTCSNVVTDGTQSVLLVFDGSTGNTNYNGSMVFRIIRDGTTQIAWNGTDAPYTPNATRQVPISIVAIDRKPPAGVHTYEVQWYTSTGTAYAWGAQMSAVVIPDA